MSSRRAKRQRTSSSTASSPGIEEPEERPKPTRRRAALVSAETDVKTGRAKAKSGVKAAEQRKAELAAILLRLCKQADQSLAICSALQTSLPISVSPYIKELISEYAIDTEIANGRIQAAEKEEEQGQKIEVSAKTVARFMKLGPPEMFDGWVSMRALRLYTDPAVRERIPSLTKRLALLGRWHYRLSHAAQPKDKPLFLAFAPHWNQRIQLEWEHLPGPAIQSTTVPTDPCLSAKRNKAKSWARTRQPLRLQPVDNDHDDVWLVDMDVEDTRNKLARAQFLADAIGPANKTVLSTTPHEPKQAGMSCRTCGSALFTKEKQHTKRRADEMAGYLFDCENTRCQTFRSITFWASAEQKAEALRQLRASSAQLDAMVFR